MKTYKITATYTENGTELLADRHYALGEHADQRWIDRDAAEAVADSLRADVGSVVDATVRYTVEESDDAIVGEWGHHDGTAGYIVCDESDRDAVQAAYDAIEDGDMSPNVLAGVRKAGGQYVAA